MTNYQDDPGYAPVPAVLGTNEHINSSSSPSASWRPLIATTFFVAAMFAVTSTGGALPWMSVGDANETPTEDEPAVSLDDLDWMASAALFKTASCIKVSAVDADIGPGCAEVCYDTSTNAASAAAFGKQFSLDTCADRGFPTNTGKVIDVPYPCGAGCSHHATIYTK